MIRPSSAWAEATLNLLRDAQLQWELGGDDVQAQRDTVANLVRELTNGIRLLGVAEGDLQPLQTLNLALFDLSHGVRNSFFEIQAPGREPDSASRRRSKLYAVALVNWLIEGGVKVGPALELVAKEFNRAGHRSHNNRDVSSNVVKKWRDTTFEGGHRKADAAVVEFHLQKWRERLGKQPWTPELAQAFVRSVAVGAPKSSQKG